MISRKQWRRFIDHPVTEWTLFVIGLLLLFVVAPLVGPIPGPGGMIVAAAGLPLLLKTSLWARRRYVRFKRWQPKAGRWTDWALRRPSARRREALRKAESARDPADVDGRSLSASEMLGSTTIGQPADRGSMN